MTIPPPLGIVSVFAGRTLGGLYIASYGKGSTLQYNELIVFSGLVRSGARIGAWISDIYVDSERSVAGGRQVWGLSKHLARFACKSEAGARAISVRDDDGSLLCEVHVEPPGYSMKLPVLAPAWSKKGGRILWFRATGSARVSQSHGEIRLPPGSVLSSRGIESGRMLLLESMDVKIGSGTYR
jgi:acetoacetate decarboxylase